MTAEFKSHVLRRDEKGFLGIPFKRWLLSGVSGGLVFAVGSIVVQGRAFILAALLAVALLILTGERYGMPRWLRWWLAWRGQLILQAERKPQGYAAQIAQFLEIPVLPTLHLDGNRLFAPTVLTAVSDLTAWVTRVEPDGEDLIFIENPLPDDLPRSA